MFTDGHWWSMHFKIQKQQNFLLQKILKKLLEASARMLKLSNEWVAAETEHVF